MTRGEFQQEIQRIKDQIVKIYQPEKIILFGSAARGDFTEDSDIDMLVVKETSKPKIDRIKKILLSVDYNVPFEPLVYTPSELRKRKLLGDSFILEVLNKGKVIYEK